tara:strand:- start:1723 stop:2226 length:504 start_codon:yes stop_codon:yes gene_type:complete
MTTNTKITEFFEETVVIPTKPKILPIIHKLYFDGGSRGNPGPSGCGYSLYVNNNEIANGSHPLGYGTNNEAEYQGILYGLRAAKNLNIKDVVVYGDSLLVINQIQGKWQCKAKNLVGYLTKARNLLRDFDRIILYHIPRKKNKRADELANAAMDQIINNITALDTSM